MPNLRSHSKDVAIGAITQRHLEYVAGLLEARARLLRHPLWKWFCRDRQRAVEVDLLAATFSRVKGVPEPMPAQFDAQVRVALESEVDLGIHR